MSLRPDPLCEHFKKKPIPATCPFVWTAREILSRDMCLQHVPSCVPTWTTPLHTTPLTLNATPLPCPSLICPGQTDATGWRDIVARNMLRPFGHRVAQKFHKIKLQSNIVQHYGKTLHNVVQKCCVRLAKDLGKQLRGKLLVHPTGFHWFVPSPARTVATCKKGSNGGTACSDLVNVAVPSARAALNAYTDRKNTKIYIDFHPAHKIDSLRIPPLYNLLYFVSISYAITVRAMQTRNKSGPVMARSVTHSKSEPPWISEHETNSPPDLWINQRYLRVKCT